MVDLCIAPEEIQEGDLVAYLEGDAPLRVKDHIARCAFCAAEIEALRKIDALFWGALLEGGDLVVDKSFSSTDPDGKRT